MSATRQPRSIGELLALPGGTDAAGLDILNAGTVAAALLSAGGGGIDADGVYGDGSRLTGLPSSPTPTLASVLAAGADAGGASVTGLGGVTATGTVAGGRWNSYGMDIGDGYVGSIGGIYDHVNRLYQHTIAGTRVRSTYPWVWTTGATLDYPAGVRLLPSAAHTLKLDDGAGGAADLTVTGGATAGGYAVGGDTGLTTAVTVGGPGGGGDVILSFSGGLLTGHT